MLKEYNKEKLHEYAKELFALCLEKDLDFKYSIVTFYIEIWQAKGDLKLVGESYVSEHLFNKRFGKIIPIWELIEKVKQL